MQRYLSFEGSKYAPIPKPWRSLIFDSQKTSFLSSIETGYSNFSTFQNNLIQLSV